MGRLIDPVDDVLWCWSCNKAAVHVVDKQPELYGGWVILTCKNCGEKQFISMYIHRNGRLAQRDLK